MGVHLEMHCSAHSQFYYVLTTIRYYLADDRRTSKHPRDRVVLRGMGNRDIRIHEATGKDLRDSATCVLQHAHCCVRTRRRGWNYADACDTVRSVARSVVRSPSRSAVRSLAWRAREGNSLAVMGIRYQSRVRRCLSETCAECLSIGTRSSPSSSLVVAGRSNAERSRDKWIRDETGGRAAIRYSPYTYMERNI